VRGLALSTKDNDGNEISKAKQKAHIVQGIESQLLVSLISKLSEGYKTGRDIYVDLALHDGCVSRVKRDSRELEKAVAKGHAGIKINIDREQYNLMNLPHG